MSFIQEAAIYLVAAVVGVTVFKRLGLGSILGYLVAGVVIGPSGVRLIHNAEDVLHFAELGVVLLLFVIGLELQPSRLWVLRRAVFGLGALQVLATAALVALGLGVAGVSVSAAIIAGIGLALSSTAIAVQLLTDKNELTTSHGRAGFAILLFQDLAVIPLLAILPLLSPGADHTIDAAAFTSIAKAVVVITAVVASGRFLVRPMFRWIASTKSQEIFTATTLLVVIGVSLLMAAVDLSMSLGAFLAGVLLADSEYRHELEADIEPFKGLLLGLFFMAVGMSANLGLLLERPVVIALGVLGIFAVKLVVLLAIARTQRLARAASLTLALALSQGGEFAFVLFNLAASGGVLARPLADTLIVVVSLSMAVTPLLFTLHLRVVEPWLARREGKREFDTIEELGNPVIIAGFGRYGQIIGRVLSTVKIGFTAMDASSQHVDFLRRFGNRIYYGDASRLDLLRAAKAEQAKLFVLAVDDVEASMRIANIVKANFPKLPIVARARNRAHAYRLIELGITLLNRETLAASLETAVVVLGLLGYDEPRARDLVRRFREWDEELLQSQAAVFKDEQKLMQTAQQAMKDLQGLFEQDAVSYEVKPS